MRILVLGPEPPWPLRYGGRLHAYELCRRLARRHSLLLLAERGSEAPTPVLPFECRIADEGRPGRDADRESSGDDRPDRLDAYFGTDPAFVREVLAVVHEWRPDVVIGMNYRTLGYLSRIREVPTIADPCDDETLHALRELLFGRVVGVGRGLKDCAAAFLFIRRHLRHVSAVSLLSEADRRFCRLYTGHPRVVCIPHGVDSEHYAPRDAEIDEHRVIFWGGLTFLPNIGAVRHFADRVWPRVHGALPDARWSIVGWGDPPELTGLRTLPGVDVVGEVDDIRPHVARAAVAVVPMLSGTGIKNKILEAWAMAKPVVCTPRALGSLPGVHGENVWLARSPRRFADAVVMLLTDGGLRRRIGRAGRETAVRHCSWDRSAERLEQLCVEVVTSARTRPAASWRAPVGPARRKTAPEPGGAWG